MEIQEVVFTNDSLSYRVMEYLIQGGYLETALEFSKEAGIIIPGDVEEQGPDRSSMPIFSAKIEEALQIFTEMYPEVLRQNLELFFHVQQQRFLEMIRYKRGQEAVEAALKFSQEEIAPIVEQKSDLETVFEETVVLLGSEDPYECTSCVSRELLGISQLLKTASEVTAAVQTIPVVGKVCSRRLRLAVLLNYLDVAQAKLHGDTVELLTED